MNPISNDTPKDYLRSGRVESIVTIYPTLEGTPIVFNTDSISWGSWMMTVESTIQRIQIQLNQIM